MAKRKVHPLYNTAPAPPAKTPEGREQQLTELAMNLVEQRLRDGTASSAETVHFLRVASTREKLEEAKLKHETEMIQAKSKAIASMEDTKKLMQEALSAMKSYQGIDEENFDD